MVQRRRLDAELVAQGFFPTTDAALRAVLAGEVSGEGRRFNFAGEQVQPGLVLHVRGREAYVSRGGRKLEHALDAFCIDPTGLRCLDVGCSTGGFTDCLLRHGARQVVAVDVGYAQFSWELRHDERVELLERTNVRSLPGSVYDRSFNLVVCDVSFTSVTTILPAIVQLLSPGATLVILVKPQFEATREEVGPGGIVRDEAVRRRAVCSVEDALTAAGLIVCGMCESPITGAKGNVEFLLCAYVPVEGATNAV